MEDLLVRKMVMVVMLSAQSIWAPAVVKLRYFGYKLLINRSLLFIRWRVILS